jgi:uracil-DNA glycosylase family 4
MRDDREKALKEIADGVENLESSPLYAYRKEHDYSPVIGEGDPCAAIMFIGEAPGKREAETGRPFVGRAGSVLDDLLESIDLDRENVYITNVVKDRPPDNRDPKGEEIELYASFLKEQVRIIWPQVIATLGRFAMDFVLDWLDMPQAGEKISDLHGKVLEAEAPHGKVKVVPLFHPAVALYVRERRETLEEDFQALKPFAS